MSSPEELHAFETLAAKVYQDVGEARAQAETELEPFRVSLDTLETTRAVMMQTREPTALLYATQALIHLVPNNWAVFSLEQKVELRDFVLGILYERARDIPNYNVTFLISLLVRVCKLGWLDNCGMDTMVSDISTFFATSFVHCLVGMEMFAQLIQEVTQPWAGHSPIQHRKYVTSFRDMALLDVFVASFDLLASLMDGRYANEDPAEQEQLAISALKVLIECVSFDFVGTMSDDSATKNTTLQIPPEWRVHIESNNRLDLLFALYGAAASYSSKALEVLSLFVVIRKSLFSTDKSRTAFITAHMQFAIRVVETNVGLGDFACYHHFCQYMSRLKSNYHVMELIKSPVYEEWLMALANFSVASFESPGTQSGSIYYILHFWNGLCSSATNASVANSKLEHLVPELVRSFVTSRLDSVEAFAAGTILDDPLGSQPLLEETLNAFPALGRFNYAGSADVIMAAYTPLESEYQAAINAAQETGGADDVVFRLNVVESQLAWLVYLSGGLVGGRTAVRKNIENDILDGHLAVRVFHLLQAADHVLEVRGDAYTNVHLERAIILFMKRFRKSHIGDQSLSSSHAYQPLASELNLPDSGAVLRVMIQKICHNLSAWSSNNDVLSMTLDLFMDLAKAPFTSLPLLAKVDAIDYLLKSHGSGNLAFLDDTSNAEPRKLFYRIMGILVFQDNNIGNFDTFMACFGDAFQSISQVLDAPDSDATMADPSFHAALQSLFHDLTGILMSARKDAHYAVFFEWMYPDYAPLVCSLAGSFYDVPEVVNPILVFWTEFVDAHSRRIKFPSASANGILLFTASSKLLLAYGSELLNNGFPDAVATLAHLRLASQGQGPSSGHPISESEEGPSGAVADQIEATLVGVELAVRSLTNSFTGEYCCFGVFSLYGDKCLSDVVDCIIQLILCVPFELLVVYPGLSSAYYAFIEVLMRNHAAEFLRQDDHVHTQILVSLREGLQSFQRRVFTQSCCALDYLTHFEYEMVTQGKHRDAQSDFERHMSSDACSVYPLLLETLMSIYLFDDNGKLPQWAVARPFLNLIVLYPQEFERLESELVARQPDHRRDIVAAALGLLTKDISRDLSTTTRDVFSQNLSSFRRALKDGTIRS